MKAFGEEFKESPPELHKVTEEDRRRNDEELLRFAGSLIAGKARGELQLVVADRMRQYARLAVKEIPDHIVPTTLVITESHLVPDGGSFTSGGQSTSRPLKTSTVTKPKNEFSAWLVTDRFQKIVDSDTKHSKEGQTLIFAPIFVAKDGELWIFSDHRQIEPSANLDLSSPEVIDGLKAGYRASLSGVKLSCDPAVYPDCIVSHNPRLAQDADLFPIDGKIISPQEGLSRWRQDLMEMSNQ